MVNYDLIKSESNDLSFMDFNNIYFNKFIEYAEVRPTTLRGYIVCLKQFYLWTRDNNISQPTRDDIKDYKKYLDESNLSQGTKSRYFRAVKQFFAFLNSENLYNDITTGIKNFKTNPLKTNKEAFSEGDIKTILDTIDRNTIQGKRDYAIILLSVVGGLRVIEMQRADIQDIKVIRNEKRLYIQGKGRDSKDEYIKLIPALDEAINDYLGTRKNLKGNDPLFIGTSNRAVNKRILETTLSKIIKARFIKAGYNSNKLTAHSLRHTSNTLLFKAGADLVRVQNHARHKNPATTEIYLHINNRDKDTSEADIYKMIYTDENSNNFTTEEIEKAILYLREKAS